MNPSLKGLDQWPNVCPGPRIGLDPAHPGSDVTVLPHQAHVSNADMILFLQKTAESIADCEAKWGWEI